jgi:amidohydrolase
MFGRASVKDGQVTGSAGKSGLADLYMDLHAHPELAFQETRTAAIVAERLTALGYETTTGVGGTGVVGVLRNGAGPTALVRADMDALPVLERTDLAYASTARATDTDGHDVPVMHACGHDVHVTCLLGAAATLSAHRSAWQGTLLLVFQPAEEVGRGARAMVDDGLFDRFGRPAVVLGQHVAPLPAGTLALRPGPAFAAADALRVVLFGRGAHGSRPEVSVDPVVMAAATVMRLQGIVSREVAGTDAAVVTVGAIRAGTKENIIPDDAELLLSTRTYDDGVRDRILAAIERIVRAEAAASGAPREPEVTHIGSFPPVVNDPEACARTRPGFDAEFGPGRVFDPGLVTASEDVGLLARAAGAPCVFWLLGGADPAAFAGASTFADIESVVRGLPSNHSPRYAPVIEPTLDMGVRALVAAVHTWLPTTAS